MSIFGILKQYLSGWDAMILVDSKSWIKLWLKYNKAEIPTTDLLVTKTLSFSVLGLALGTGFCSAICLQLISLRLSKDSHVTYYVFSHVSGLEMKAGVQKY